MFKTMLTACALIGTAACLPAAAADGVPAGTYTLDKPHGSLIFRVNHLGFSHFTARFTRFDATLEFDPDNLAASSVTATVDASSIETDYPDPEQFDFNAQLRGEDWLDTAHYPRMTFRSQKVAVTGDHELRIDGQLTLHGVTHPVLLRATYNGGYAGFALDPHARIGFSAHGTLRRSDYGLTVGIPKPGSLMGVGDEVEVIIEAEFSGPPWPGAGQGSEQGAGSS